MKKKQVRENLRKIVLKKFQNIELDIDKDLVFTDNSLEESNIFFDMIAGKDTAKVQEVFDNLIEFFESFKENNATKDEKEIVKVLIDDLYKYTDNKGVQNNLWKYMNQTMFIGKVSDDMEKIKNLGVSKETTYFLFLSLYISFYELMFQYLSEICLIIARGKKSRYSTRLINEYNKKSKRGMSLFRRDVIEFMKKEKYIKAGRKFFLSDSLMRDKPAHSLVYYDISKNKLILGEAEVDPEIIMDKFSEIYDFILCLLSYTFEKANVIEGIKGIREHVKLLKDIDFDKIDWSKLINHGK